jgi:outer membrane protein
MPDDRDARPAGCTPVLPRPVALPVLLTAAAGLALALAGCGGQGPLGRSDDDYDRRVSLARLSTIDPLTLDRESGMTPDEVLASENEPSPAEQLRSAFQAGEPVELSIERARASALEHNLDLRVALVNPVLASERIDEEEARFESLIAVNAQAADTDSPVALSTESSQARSYFLNPELRVPLRTGGQFSVSTPMSRVKNNNPFATLNPAYTTDLELSLSHNLLRGAGRRANSFQIRIADYDRQISAAQTRLEVIRQLAAAERGYWRLYAARQALSVRYQQYEVALNQLEQARRRFDAGQEAEIEVVRAESGVADRVEAIIVAENEVLLRQRDLKRIMNIPGLGVDTDEVVIPTSDPDPVAYELDPSALADAAMDRRMELLELELRLAADAATIAFRENQALPLLALSYTYRINGLGGTFNESLNRTSENNFEDWILGLNAEIPLGNGVRNSQVEQAVLTRLQRLASRDARRQAIRQEVFDAVDSIGSGWQRIIAARRAVLLSARTLEAERRQFGVGRSTSTDVLDADARLAEAQLAEIRAVVEYEISQIDLAFATGTLLGHSRVEWGPLDPRGPADPIDEEPGDEFRDRLDAPTAEEPIPTNS